MDVELVHRAELVDLKNLQLLTPEQVSELLNVPVSVLASWRTKRRAGAPGFLRFVKVGGKARYLALDIQRYIEQNIQ